jgi:hypothetical protein
MRWGGGGLPPRLPLVWQPNRQPGAGRRRGPAIGWASGALKIQVAPATKFGALRSYRIQHNSGQCKQERIVKVLPIEHNPSHRRAQGHSEPAGTYCGDCRCASLRHRHNFATLARLRQISLRQTRRTASFQRSRSPRGGASPCTSARVVPTRLADLPPGRRYSSSTRSSGT